MADKDLKIKVSAETTAAEKQIKESFRSQTEASKRQLAIQAADYKAMLRAHESALKDNARFDINLQKQVDREKLQAHKEWLKQIKFNSAVVNKQIADEQKALMKSGKGKGMSGFQMLEFGENLTVVSAGLMALTSRVSAFVNDAMTLGGSLTVLQSNFKGTAKDLELFKLATAGTVTEANLIKLSNQARDLGISLDKQALLFLLAEQAGDKYGGSVEENIQRVVLAIAKNGRGLEDLGVTTVNYKKVFSELLKERGLSADDLDEETRLQVGYDAIMKITGLTLKDVAANTQDVADKKEALKVMSDEVKTAFGQGVNKTFEELYNAGNEIVTAFNKMTGSESTLKQWAAVIGESLTKGILTPLLSIIDLIKTIENNPLLSMALNGVGRGGGFNPRSEYPKGENAERLGRLGDDAQRALRTANFGESASKTLEDTQTIYGTVSQTMSLIGITTDSFLGKLVGGFGTVLTIMESIKAVNTIFSFIPGLATGGLTSGVNWVGEQGKELLFSPGSYVMNHSDSMRFVNQNSSGSNVNVYLAGNIDVTAALKKENKKYRYITVKQ